MSAKLAPIVWAPYKSFPVYAITGRSWWHWTFDPRRGGPLAGWIETERPDVRAGLLGGLFVGDSRLKADAAVNLAKRGAEGLRWEGA